MSRVSGVFFGLAFAVVLISPVAVFGISSIGGNESLTDGVYCEINEVKLFAKTAEDCEKAGGAVTHTVTTTVEPAESEKE